MIGRLTARADHVVVGGLVWSAPGHLVGWLAEPAWPYVFFPLLAYGLWRGLTVRVTETPDGLRVRNVVLSFAIAWPDVTDVAWYEPYAVGNWHVVPGLRVRGRRWRVPVLAMAGWQRPRREDAATVRRWQERVASIPNGADRAERL